LAGDANWTSRRSAITCLHRLRTIASVPTPHVPITPKLNQGHNNPRRERVVAGPSSLAPWCCVLIDVSRVGSPGGASAGAAVQASLTIEPSLHSSSRSAEEVAAVSVGRVFDDGSAAALGGSTFALDSDNRSESYRGAMVDLPAANTACRTVALSVQALKVTGGMSNLIGTSSHRRCAAGADSLQARIVHATNKASTVASAAFHAKLYTSVAIADSVRTDAAKSVVVRSANQACCSRSEQRLSDSYWFADP
jgi:hypothetical protein